MKNTEKNTIYAAKRGKAYIGLFSSFEKAMECKCDTLEEIRPIMIEGTPASERYICAAEGVVSTLFRQEDSFKVEYTDLGPVWGVNMQSAIIQLLGNGSRRHNLEITTLRIYEIDKNYSEGLPDNLAREYGFIADRLSQDDVPTNGVLSRDYIASYFERERRDAEIGERYHSKHMDSLIHGIMKSINSRGVPRCGFAYSKQLERTRRMLSLHFSLKELQTLAVLCGVETDEKISELITNGTISNDKLEELMEKYRRCLPRIKLHRPRNLKNID